MAGESIHFIGICGTAMASAAAAMKARGYHVSGSDENVYPPMSDFLEKSGIPVMAGYSADNLAHKPDRVVIGNAISRGNPEAEYVLEQKLGYCSLPELLKDFFIRGKRSIVVAGTHGKTTTTSLLTWLFEHSGRHPNYLIGGIPSNFSEGARFTGSPWFIIEGDEYDTAFFDKRSKFIHYLPEIVIMNNLEFDHADIFENLAAIQLSFSRLANIVPRNGLIVANGDERNLDVVLQKVYSPVMRFGLGTQNDCRASGLQLRAGHSSFTVTGPGRPPRDFSIPMTGELNVRNALAALGVARHCGLSDQEIQAGFDTFLGVRRRMETRGEVGGVTLIDDFGHHPTAIAETLKALRIKFPGSRLWAIFEPRSNTTRRRVFQRELFEALALSDAIIISQVARLDQLPSDDRLDPERLMSDLQGQGRSAAYLQTVDQIIDSVAAQADSGDVVCVFSNGGFGGIHQKLLDALNGRK